MRRKMTTLPSLSLSLFSRRRPCAPSKFLYWLSPGTGTASVLAPKSTCQIFKFCSTALACLGPRGPCRNCTTQRTADTVWRLLAACRRSRCVAIALRALHDEESRYVQANLLPNCLHVTWRLDANMTPCERERVCFKMDVARRTTLACFKSSQAPCSPSCGEEAVDGVELNHVGIVNWLIDHASLRESAAV